jgi:hypothetical protein
MKKTVQLVILFATLLSCSNNKKENEKQILLLMDQKSVLIDKQKSEMDNSSTYLKKCNEHIYNMTSAGASPTEIEKLESEKEIGLKKFEQTLKDIEIKLDNNSVKIDSIMKL